jgi:predicted restriction endonuclease
MPTRNWTRDELLAAFNLYCHTPFGKLHRGNPEIIQLANQLGRTSSSVAMKMVNFASLDPVQQARNIKGLANASLADRELWENFNHDPEAVALESMEAFKKMSGEPLKETATESEPMLPIGATDKFAIARVRLVQSFFRNAVLVSYEYQCAICNLAIVELLTASHIVPWSHDETHRADPRNGLCLCALHDRAFDKGLLAFDEQLQLCTSSKLKGETHNRMQQVGLVEYEGVRLTMPKRFAPNPTFIAYHREHIFKPK